MTLREKLDDAIAALEKRLETEAIHARGPAEELHDRMSAWSEDVYYAGWLVDLEIFKMTVTISRFFT